MTVRRARAPARSANRMRLVAIATLVAVSGVLGACVGGPGSVRPPTGTASSSSSNVPHY